MAELTRIRMELTRTEGYPARSHLHGYEFVAPLTNAGRIDAAAWRSQKEKCRVRRFWAGEPDKMGTSRRIGRGWRFDYDGDETNGDEPFLKLDRHRIMTGAYVWITERDGIQHLCRIVETIPIHERNAA